MFRVLLTAAAVLALANADLAHAHSCATHAQQTSSETGDIVDTAVAAGDFATLVAAVEAAGLADVLKGDGPFTVFAPNDAAFAKLPEGTVERLLEDKAALAEVLTYHVVPGKVMAADVVKVDWAETVQGQSLLVRVDGDQVTVDGARVVATDIKTSNGVIHVIDQVVTPRKDLVGAAIDAGSFKTLTNAVKAAGLVETLRDGGPFTVFAPSDAAFAKLPDGTLDALLADEAQLRNILAYHVVPGRILASDLADKGKKRFEIETVQGGALAITVDKDGSVSVNDAKVTSVDVIAGNGVIHVIDGVVLPPSS